MHHCPSDEIKRRLALDLLQRPPHRNRPRSRRRHYRQAMASMLAGGIIIALAFAIANLQ